MKDYFNHIPETPQEVQQILARMQKEHAIKDALDYSDLNRYIVELESCGWTFDYDLSCGIFNLRPKNSIRITLVEACVKFKDQENLETMLFCLQPFEEVKGVVDDEKIFYYGEDPVNFIGRWMQQDFKIAFCLKRTDDFVTPQL